LILVSLLIVSDGANYSVPKQKHWSFALGEQTLRLLATLMVIGYLVLTHQLSSYLTEAEFYQTVEIWPNSTNQISLHQ